MALLCMDRTLLFQLDMIPSARQGLKCGLQWDPGPVHDRNSRSTCIRLQVQLGQQPL